jgi:hypothetical protein
MDIEINWKENAFTLWQPSEQAGSFKLVPETATLYVETATLAPTLKVDLDAKFLKHNVTYRYTDLICESEVIGTGASRYQTQNLIKISRTPLKIFVGFVKSKAFNGHKSMNP